MVKDSVILHIYLMSSVKNLLGEYALSGLKGFFSTQVFYLVFMGLSKTAQKIAEGKGILENTKRQADCTDCSG